MRQKRKQSCKPNESIRNIGQKSSCPGQPRAHPLALKCLLPRGAHSRLRNQQSLHKLNCSTTHSRTPQTLGPKLRQTITERFDSAHVRLRCHLILHLTVLIQPRKPRIQIPGLHKRNLHCQDLMHDASQRPHIHCVGVHIARSYTWEKSQHLWCKVSSRPGLSVQVRTFGVF